MDPISSLQKLMYILRRSSRSDNTLLRTFAAVLREGLTKMFKVDLDDIQRSQCNLVVRAGSVEIRVELRRDITPFCIQPHQTSTKSLQNSILPSTFSNIADES